MLRPDFELRPSHAALLSLCPATTPAAPAREINESVAAQLGSLTNYRFGSLDPFESYPPTRLPREHVQRLIHSFLHKIAFQYYPLDLNATSNPFLVSWWPLALGDPALFHVSLQTACLDEEMLARKGFQSSEILMADSVALLRRKVFEPSLAIQDGTMNSVITLAAIEFGKGNTKVSEMHVDGAKKLVKMRGGINSIRQTSPLTARMVSWVSMLITGQPQFETQDDIGSGDDDFALGNDIALDVCNVFTRLRNVFLRARHVPLEPARLHDLTCFVVHRLLFPVSDATSSPESHVSSCVRYAIVLYMFILQGPTYFSHAVLFNQIVDRFAESLRQTAPTNDHLDIWLLAIALVSSNGTAHYLWVTEKAQRTAYHFGIRGRFEALARIQRVLWLDNSWGEDIFGPYWDFDQHGGVEFGPLRYAPGTKANTGYSFDIPSLDAHGPKFHQSPNAVTYMTNFSARLGPKLTVRYPQNLRFKQMRSSEVL
ncbi:unnamed protein product [Parascedosporium putredinis]|uniref:Transcription factor domain-containing protein n=1 Tax=Parascedosporium putredinis TaxID=1442378 RepID=A0A9P1GXC5_9PEZI|nr:unnamed protein product [Parascedosporium putredinis]CAI7989671.1 unnamed protein product [Parascedosporium putredinis]